MSHFFQFEADFVESLRCIPMQVRYKLDTCGVKLKLQHWHQLTQGERQSLVVLPCGTEVEVASYRDHLQRMVVAHTGQAAGTLPIEDFPAWVDEASIPVSVQEKAAETGAGLTLEQWRSLSPIQRFVLIKLSRSGHENSNFLPAMKEFQLV